MYDYRLDIRSTTRIIVTLAIGHNSGAFYPGIESGHIDKNLGEIILERKSLDDSQQLKVGIRTIKQEIKQVHQIVIGVIKKIMGLKKWKLKYEQESQKELMVREKELVDYLSKRDRPFIDRHFSTFFENFLENRPTNLHPSNLTFLRILKRSTNRTKIKSVCRYTLLYTFFNKRIPQFYRNHYQMSMNDEYGYSDGSDEDEQEMRDRLEQEEKEEKERHERECEEARQQRERAQWQREPIESLNEFNRDMDEVALEQECQEIMMLENKLVVDYKNKVYAY